jgi:hypothetical protein
VLTSDVYEVMIERLYVSGAHLVLVLFGLLGSVAVGGEQLVESSSVLPSPHVRNAGGPGDFFF